MDTKEMCHYALQIEKLTADRSYENIRTLLGDLEKLHVTAEQLETTDIVKVLYRLLKTCTDNNLRKMVKNLLSNWKKLHGKDQRGGDYGDKVTQLPSVAGIEEDGNIDPRNSQLSSAQTKEEKDKLCCVSSTERVSLDSLRAKCVDLLFAAFRPEHPDEDSLKELAQSVEHHIHKLHQSNQAKYKACIRSKVANLRNPKNTHLHQGLRSGSLTAEAFAQMSTEEMANAELRQLRESLSAQGVNERQLPQGVEGTQTRRIRCKRCNGSDCRVTQVSRGALFLPAWVRRGGPDEDAMTFVTCDGCGQQWYHSGWHWL